MKTQYTTAQPMVTHRTITQHIVTRHVTTQPVLTQLGSGFQADNAALCSGGSTVQAASEISHRPSRGAATLLEVLFATVVIVIGLLGIATLIPFAARDAQTANNHNQAVSLGLAWADAFFARGLHISNANTSESNFKWVWFRDYTSNGFAPGWEPLLRDGYTVSGPNPPGVRVGGIVVDGLVEQSGSASNAATQRFRIWGHQPVCIDPFVLTSQSALSRIQNADSRPGWYRLSTFPYFNEAYDPATDPFGSVGGFAVDQPRMIRAGLAFTIPPTYSPFQFAPVSNQLMANLFSSMDDVVEDAFIDEADRTEISDALPAKRLFQEFTNPNGGIIPTRALLNKRFSWKATIVPEEPIPTKVDTPTNANLYANIPAKSALVSLLVLHRHSSEFVGGAGNPINGDTENKPTGERLVRVYPLSGNFVGGAGGRVRLVGNQYVKSNLEVGDWIMLGRYFLRDSTGTRFYPYFRWYRIIGMDAAVAEGPVGVQPIMPVYSDAAPYGNQYGNVNAAELGWARDVVLDGPDFAFGEYMPSIAPTSPYPWWPGVSPTTGTIVSGVVTVVERRVQLD